LPIAKRKRQRQITRSERARSGLRRCEAARTREEQTKLRDELLASGRGLPCSESAKESVRRPQKDQRRSRAVRRAFPRLAVYHFMFGPDYRGRMHDLLFHSLTASNGILAHLRAHDVTMICVSSAHSRSSFAYRKRDGLDLHWGVDLQERLQCDLGFSSRRGSDTRVGHTDLEQLPTDRGQERAVRPHRRGR